jgi:hypothetical protein
MFVRAQKIAVAALSVAGLAGLASIAPAAAGVTGSSDALTFGVPRIVDPLHSYGEPDLKVSPVPGPNGPSAAFASGPAGTGTQRSVWDVSVDDGDSYRVVSDVPQGAAPAQAPAKETNGPGGGDTEIAFDHTGKAYYADLYALKCYTVATTADNGATVSSNPNGCSGGSVEADRQWFGVYDPPAGTATTSPYNGPTPLLYMKYTGTSGAQVDKSTDGLNFTSAGSHGNNQDSPIVVDQATGDVIEAISSGNKVGLTVGTPDAAGALTFTNHLSTYTAPGGIATLFPVIAQDSDRNVYIAYVPDCGEQNDGGLSDPACFHVYYMWAGASDNWTTFHGPFRVDAPDPATGDNTAVMPWIAAGEGGIVDIAWYGTPKRMDPSNTESGSSPRAWYTEMAQVTNAASEAPSVTTGRASPHPMHYNSICLNGTGCIESQGDRNLADFFQVTIDHQGRARIIYDDTSNGLEQAGFTATDGLADHKGAELVTVATQNTGVDAWTGAALSPKESTAPVASITDPTGDSLVNKALGGTYAKGADITGLTVAPDGANLKITATTAGDSLGSAAVSAESAFAQLVVRWQMGNTLYYAEAEQPATGTPTEFYAGQVQSIDLCSVSACDPHYFVYPGAANGGNSVTGTTTSDASGTTYTIEVPLSDIGSPTNDSRLEEVDGYVFAAPMSANVTAPNAAAQAEQGIPTEIEGTKTFNASLGAPGPQLPETPLAVALPLVALLAIVIAGGLRRRNARRSA